MAKTVTIGGRDTGRTGSGSGGGGNDLVGKSATVDKSGNVSWHGGGEHKDGGGYPSSSNGYGGDHGGRDSTRGYGSYSEHFDNGTPVTRYGRKLVASEAAFEKAKFASSFAAHYVSKTPAYTAQEMVGWLEHTNNTQNLKFNLPYKEINLSGKSVTNEDMVFFASRMKNFAFHLDSLQLNHNPISDYGIQALFNCVFTVPLGRSVVHLKLNNCNFCDVGAELIAAYVRDGYMPATRVIDVSGNNISIENPCFAQLAKNIQQPIKIVVDTIYDGAKKQGTLVFGSKEAKQGIVQDWVNIAQSNGIDTKNVVVSKDIFEAVINSGKLFDNFHLGWAKCSVVPKDVKSFAADKILAIASPEAGVIKTGIDIAFCYFASCDEAMSSQHGVQFLGDLGLLPQGEFIDAIE